MGDYFVVDVGLGTLLRYCVVYIYSGYARCARAGKGVGVGLVYATLIPSLDRAKMFADKLTAGCPDFRFQVREAGKSKIVYDPQRAAPERGAR